MRHLLRTPYITTLRTSGKDRRQPLRARAFPSRDAVHILSRGIKSGSPEGPVPTAPSSVARAPAPTSEYFHK